MGNREFCRFFAIDLIGSTDRNLVQISQDIQDGESDIRAALQPAAISGSHAVIPAHSSGTAGGSSVLAAVTAAPPQLICFRAEDLGGEFTRAHC